MKIRDLTDKQIKKLQKRSNKEFKEKSFIQNANGYFLFTADELVSCYRQAWSNGLKAGLEFAGEVAESIVSK